MRVEKVVYAVLVGVPLVAAENDSKATFLKHWQVAKKFTLEVAESMPAESWGFKPNPEEMSFGQVMNHIANDNTMMCARVARSKPIPRIPETSDKLPTVKFLVESFDKCAREIDALSPEQWDMEVYKYQGQPIPAHEALLYTYTHMAHHRGQAEVYLRLKNIKQPEWQF